MLVWAREEVGYSIEEAAEAIGISVETLEEAEHGKRSLTLNQLRKAAEQYDFPFGYFYLSKPPYEKTYKPVPDYRVEPGLVGRSHHRLALEIKKVRDRRLIFMDVMASLGNEVELFKTMPEEMPPENIGVLVRERLGVSDAKLADLAYDDVYPYWKSKIEKDGVLVYESQYIPDESGVIGVAIFYETYPIILLKRGGDYNARRLFTLLHEYSHLLLGRSAINDAVALTLDEPVTDVGQLEIRCNRMAADILVPPAKLDRIDYETLAAVDKMELLANKFKVTYTTAAVCLKRFGLISNFELSELLELRRKARKRAQERKPAEVRIPRENIMRLDMGRPMFRAVLDAYGSGLLDVFDASKILNLRVKKINKLASSSSL